MNRAVFSLKYADEVDRLDRGILIEAARQYGFAVEDVDDSLRADHNVVMAAVRQSDRAYAHESQDYRRT